jgi:RNA polymerase sigma-70 factor (ECF subfamily)
VKDDVRLIDETLGGDAAAFGQLVTRYQDRLYNTVVHVVGSSDTAYDVVQDAFVQAYTKLEKFERASAFYTWLYRIAVNLAISRRRREKPMASIDQVREVLGNEPLDDAELPAAQLEQRERACQVHQALSALSEEHRTILTLREMEDFSYEQIAEILELPVGTIRSRLHRARMQLRDQLKDVIQEYRT